MSETQNILFLCTGNSARSILAEALMNRLGAPRFRGYSAGSHPSGRVNPYALKQLESAGLPTADLRSKSWDEFALPGAPQMRFIITVCDNAAAEACPIWPGHPTTAHWGIPDPAAVQGRPEAFERAFRDAFLTMKRRIELFLSLPLEKLDALALKKEMTEIGGK